MAATFWSCFRARLRGVYLSFKHEETPHVEAHDVIRVAEGSSCLCAFSPPSFHCFFPLRMKPPFSSDETQTQPYLRLGLEPRGWDSNPLSFKLKPLTWSETAELISGLNKAQVLLSQHRKNSARGKATGKT